MPKVKACPVCSAEVVVTGRNIYCGVECRKAAYKQRRDESQRLRLSSPKDCRHCGSIYVPSSVNKLYCSDRCKDDHSIVRRKARGARIKTNRCLESQRQYNQRPDVKARRAELRNARLKDLRKEPRFNLEKRVSEQIRSMLKGGKRGRSWADLAPFDVQELKDHLERQFLPGMSWRNMPEWHIDHIVPKSTFEYESPEDDGFKAAWALTNLRPMWAEDNVRKGAARLYLI